MRAAILYMCEMFFEFSFDISLICDLFLATLGENILADISSWHFMLLYREYMLCFRVVEQIHEFSFIFYISLTAAFSPSFVFITILFPSFFFLFLARRHRWCYSNLYNMWIYLCKRHIHTRIWRWGEKKVMENLKNFVRIHRLLTRVCCADGVSRQQKPSPIFLLRFEHTRI